MQINNTKTANSQIINDHSLIPNCDPDKSSIISIVCRICYDGEKDESIITPCKCKGTVAFVHRSCLETWLAESNTTSCELCHYVYKTEKTLKYTARQSIWRWFRYQPLNMGFHVRGLRSDILACTVLTPLAIVITYICLFSADYYNQKKYSNIPAAKWTSISLLVLISIMLMGYYLWVYMVIRYHGRIWYYCWQRDCVVRYIAPNTRNVCCQHELNRTSVEILPTSVSVTCAQTAYSIDPSVAEEYSQSTTIQNVAEETTELDITPTGTIQNSNISIENRESVVIINDVNEDQ